jgi:vacuolar-type H+-ATPase subunit H
MVDAAREQAHGIVSDANESANLIMADAKARAASILEAGQAQASEALAGVAGQLSILQAKVNDLTTEVAELEAKKLDVEVAASAAQAKLDKVAAQIRKLAEV